MTKLHFLGDSHLGPVRVMHDAGRFAPYPVTITLVGGATAVGLRHPTSKTQALQVYRTALQPFDPDVIPVFQLGEVDCGFVIWVRAQRYGETVLQQLSASLDAYQAFLLEVRDSGYRDLIVTSAALPTIFDGQLDGEVAHLRREVRATQQDRTDLTLLYNLRLENFCRRERIAFVDLARRVFNPEARLMDDRFRHPDPADHHMDPDAAGPIWVDLVTAAIPAHRRRDSSSPA